jgi:hypothetical protein
MKNETLITVILDRSGSMSRIKSDMEGGFDTFIKEQKSDKADSVKVNLYQFSDYCSLVYANKPINQVPKLSIQPSGWTALRDAMGRAIDEVGAGLANLSESERPSRVVFVIVTDGEENKSTRYSIEKLASMVKHQQEKYNWEFIFLGANQDSFLVARQLNFKSENVMDFAYNSEGTNAMFSSVASNVKSYRSSGDSKGLAFKQADRDAQKDAGVNV